MMDFHSEFSRIFNPVIYNEGSFPGERSRDVDTFTFLPVRSPTNIEPILSSGKNPTPINEHQNEIECISLKRERMLENGQIKIFTLAIDSYYNSISNPVPSPSTDKTLNTTLTANFTSQDTMSNIEMSPITDNLTSCGNQVARISKSSISTSRKDRQEEKVWNPDAGKKILAVYFSPMNIKSEFLSKQTVLDGFEVFALQEAASAIRQIATHQHSDEILKAHKADLCADPRPVDLVSCCQKSRAFRKLHLRDKINLLKNAFLDLNAMKNIVTYNPKIEGWYFCGNIYTRNGLYLKNPDLLKKAFYIMDTFPSRFKTDINVLALLFMIIIFNANLSELVYRNTIKSEQYTYIYLLRRYLESYVEPSCDALDNFYQLMATIEEIQELKRATKQDFDDAQTNGYHMLMDRLVRFIELDSVQQ